MDSLFQCFLFLFIFTTFNRTFQPIGIDLRYIVAVIAFLLLVAKGVRLVREHGAQHGARIRYEKAQVEVLLFYLFMFISYIAWSWNGLTPGSQFVELFILNACNAIFSITIILWHREIRPGATSRYAIISLAVMAMSILWVNCFGSIPSFLIDNGVRVESLSTEVVNLFGSNVRSAGFAEDSNLACMFSVIGLMIAIMRYRPFQIVQICLSALFLVCIGLSFSRTVLLGAVATIVVCVIRSVVKRSWRTIAWIIALFVTFMALYGMEHVAILRDSNSMMTRFTFWECARQGFLSSPIIGNGLSSVRSLINILFQGAWYVQCHSTFWQVLCEQGVIGLVLFVFIIGKRLSLMRTIPQVFVMFLLIVLCTTYEMEYQQVFVFSIVLFPLIVEKWEKGIVTNEKR